jgi:hypothetical protein
MSEKKLPLKKEIDGDAITQAHEQAEKDIEKDPDLNASPKPGDDLDEGELARLEGDD